jgi:hypothetical protein
MKNKLLITSALAAGSLMAGSIANAQTYYEKGNGYGTSTTTVGGDLALLYSAVRKTGGTAAALAGGTNGLGSTRGFGRESQLNISNRGKLNNGMDYAAGFSLEFDGTGVGNSMSATENPTISNENVYFDLIIGNTTLTAGLDHIQRQYNGSVPQVFNITELMVAAGSATTYVVGAATSEYAGVGIMQKVPSIGNFAAYYVPRAGDTGSGDVNKITSNGGGNSAYEISYIGTDIGGLKGLGGTFMLNSMKATQTSAPNNVKGVVYGVSYNFGTIAVGYDRFKDENAHNLTSPALFNALSEGATPGTKVTKRYGVTYAVDSNMTVGYVSAVTDAQGLAYGALSGNSETVRALQVGYNFGPVALSASATKFTNLMTNAGANNEDSGKMGQVRLTTKF